MDEYPKRPKFFACRLIRLLFKTCAAQEIGATGTLLVTCVAMTEDAAAYTRAVTFYDGQLLPIIGIESQKALAKARSKAVAAGWLHYTAGCKGRAGSYWATIPAHAGSHDDFPTDEGHDNARRIPRQKDVETGVESGTIGHGKGLESGTIGHGKGQPFFPVPIPLPLPSKDASEESPTLEEKSNPEKTPPPTPLPVASGPRVTWQVGRTQQQQEFIDAFPKKLKPKLAADAYEAAIARLVGSRGVTDAEAHEWLMGVVRRYAKSPAGAEPTGAKDYRPSAHQWLESESYDEPESAWRFASGDAPRTPAKAKVPKFDDGRKAADTKTGNELTRMMMQ